MHHKYMTLLFLFFMACTAAKSPNPPAPVVAAPVAPPVKIAFVQWDKKMVDLGKVKKGEKKTLFYEFTNTSGEEIQIEIVDACDCTKVEFPRGVLAPGAKGRLDVIFNSAEKDADETIGINIVFKNTTPDGIPRIEVVEYKFQIER